MQPYYDKDGVTLYHGDCREVLSRLEESNIHAVVTDPPYELGFMGRTWDGTGVSFKPETWAASERVLKPGGHLLAFGGSRTFHRIACAIEDAGFEIRDTLSWLYGTGFPKSLDVAKAIESGGGRPEDIRRMQMGEDYKPSGRGRINYDHGAGSAMGGAAAIWAPTTDAARHWQGWGTALKPAWEPIILARKPLTGTVAANVQAWGTGALNVDGCRIATSENLNGGAYAEDSAKGRSGSLAGGVLGATGREYVQPTGRWPANVVLDEEAAAALDAQTGMLKSGAWDGSRNTPKTKNAYGAFGGAREAPRTASEGGASRFFYCAKASRSERGEGNTHPTVKPLALIQWLVRLVTPPGGLVLDPFAGSGTTLLAARAEGFSAVGVEMEEAHCEIIVRRLEAAFANNANQRVLGL